MLDFFFCIVVTGLNCFELVPMAQEAVEGALGRGEGDGFLRCIVIKAS